MSVNVLRTAEAWWVETGEGAVRITTSATTTGRLLADRDAIDAAVSGGPAVPVESLELLSPVTAPCRVVAQMTNFASHAKDSGMDPATLPLTFFRKTSGSLSGPYDDVVRPAHVRLLDYEVEIGLVAGRTLRVGSEVGDIADWVAGLVIANDISARDLQLPKTQFYEAKSYPTFTPVGPRLVLLDAGELERLPELRLKLTVNGEVRQDMPAADMIYRPVEALRTLAGFQRLDPGDLLLTGTPAGTALSAPPKPVEMIGSLLPAAVKWRIFFGRQAKNPRYLRDGDVIVASIATGDGAIDLGAQRTVVRYA
ncbi:fumarylacetoacetate hydrolase family protein [Spirillospora sp. NPDC029432]|uniref:fumarylacetoacetate hydrolase family protein n=1 Tax=Spirillospora sp. NPDC029432 TaxID=3154599 RepID=UPI00345482BA